MGSSSYISSSKIQPQQSQFVSIQTDGCTYTCRPYELFIIDSLQRIETKKRGLYKSASVYDEKNRIRTKKITSLQKTLKECIEYEKRAISYVRSLCDVDVYITDSHTPLYELRGLCDKLDTNHFMIILNSRLNIDDRLYSLLHECGHIVQSFDTKFYECYPKAQKTWSSFDVNAREEKSNVAFVDVLGEELNAWERAYRIARSLDILIDEKRWMIIRSKNIVSYARK
jgi:hypothetical protein